MNSAFSKKIIPPVMEYGISTKARAATYQWLMPRALPAAGVFAQTELNRFTGSCSAGTVPTQRRAMPPAHDGRR